MNKLRSLARIGVVCVSSFTGILAAQQAPTPGVPVSVLVTLEPRRGKAIPPVEAQDITVYEGKDKRPVTGLNFVGQSPMQLLLLIDDSARSTFDTQIPSLKQFVNSVPAEVQIGIAYMRNGMADFTQNFTPDHAAAANAIRVATGPGGADVSPYDSLADAVKKWPPSDTPRKDVIMISSGIEGLGGGFYPDNPYVSAGIEAAQKAGLVVYTIYNPSVGHLGHSLWETTWGQNFLSLTSESTGGEFYAIGFVPPVSFDPFLKQILDQMQHQYVLSFEARPEQKSGLQPIRVAIPNKDASIAAPTKVFVRASM